MVWREHPPCIRLASLDTGCVSNAVIIVAIDEDPGITYYRLYGTLEHELEEQFAKLGLQSRRTLSVPRELVLWSPSDGWNANSRSILPISSG